MGLMQINEHGSTVCNQLLAAAFDQSLKSS